MTEKRSKLPLAEDRTFLASVTVFLLSTAVILTALFFQHILKYQPCELCFLQRKPWYFTVSFGLLMVFFASKGEAWVRHGLLLIGFVLLISAGLGAWHAGIEWKWWPGPASCTGSGGLQLGVLPDLNQRVVLCDEAPFRFLGLSFAGWNFVVSLIGAGIAFWGAAGTKRPDRSGSGKRI